jgi:hypothetical protein
MAGDVKAAWPTIRRGLAIGFEIMLSIAAAVVLAMSGTVDGNIGIFGREPSASAVLIGLGALLLLAGGLLVARRTIPLERLRYEEPTLRKRAALGGAALLRLMRTEVRALAKRARYASNERVSLYREENEGFTLLARYSDRPAFDQSVGRDLLPCGEGVIGEAWDLASAEETELPHPGSGTLPTQEWLDAQREMCGIDPSIATDFAMRSQAYVAFRIASEDPKGQGVIVFESTLSAADLSGSDTGPMLSVAELEPHVREASERLARLLIESRPLARDEIRSLLRTQQGPNPATQAADASP